MSNEPKKTSLDIERFCKVMSEIMSEKYGCEITYTATRKDEKESPNKAG